METIARFASGFVLGINPMTRYINLAEYLPNKTFSPPSWLSTLITGIRKTNETNPLCSRSGSGINFTQRSKIKSRILPINSNENFGADRYGLHNDKYTKIQSYNNCVIVPAPKIEEIYRLRNKV